MMSDQYAFQLMNRTRQGLLKHLESLPADKRGVVPAGFNNNVHWQLGHIITVTDGLIHRFSGRSITLPEQFAGFFGPGTKPADWTEDPPAWDDLIQLLKDQPARLRETFEPVLEEPVAQKDNFASAVTVGDLFHLCNAHESSHTGMVNAMVRILK